MSVDVWAAPIVTPTFERLYGTDWPEFQTSVLMCIHIANALRMCKSWQRTILRILVPVDSRLQSIVQRERWERFLRRIRYVVVLNFCLLTAHVICSVTATVVAVVLQEDGGQAGRSSSDEEKAAGSTNRGIVDDDEDDGNLHEVRSVRADWVELSLLLY